VRAALEELIADYAASSHGIEIRQVAGGYRMSTKPSHHDVVRDFAKSLKPPIRLSLPALETLAVIAYKQPVTVPEISEIRRRGFERCHRHPARPETDHHRRPQGSHRPADSLQVHQRIPAALWPEGRGGTAQHGGVREAGGGIVQSEMLPLSDGGTEMGISAPSMPLLEKLRPSRSLLRRTVNWKGPPLSRLLPANLLPAKKSRPPEAELVSSWTRLISAGAYPWFDEAYRSIDRELKSNAR